MDKVNNIQTRIRVSENCGAASETGYLVVNCKQTIS